MVQGGRLQAVMVVVGKPGRMRILGRAVEANNVDGRSLPQRGDSQLTQRRALAALAQLPRSFIGSSTQGAVGQRFELHSRFRRGCSQAL
eukprot:1714255-Pleurochrysis_carterae.AAC.1